MSKHIVNIYLKKNFIFLNWFLKYFVCELVYFLRVLNLNKKALKLTI